jgi:hypothetical protein
MDIHLVKGRDRTGGIVNPISWMLDGTKVCRPGVRPMAFTYGATAIVSAVLFLVYGGLCLFSNGMEEEFARYGLSRFRRLTGALELLGGAGLLVGLLVPEVMVVASAGLAILMLLGVVARVRVRDPLLEIVPAAVLMVANGFLLAQAWNVLALV